jgi:hypothetical protein
MQLMWNVNTKVIPVTAGAIESISKSLRKYLSNVGGINCIKKLQNTAIEYCAVPKVLM